jgi:hypothetical protein
LHPTIRLRGNYSAIAYYYAGLDELAEEMYRHPIEIDPAPQEPHWMHARMLLYIGKAHDAEGEMRQVLVTNPDQFKALAFLGSFLYYQGKLDEAEKISTGQWNWRRPRAITPSRSSQVSCTPRGTSARRLILGYSSIGRKTSSTAMSRTIWEELMHFLDRGSLR